ncbi:MAG: DUF3667 domain-containing protein [Candidatus Cryptobacteroides sp.]
MKRKKAKKTTPREVCKNCGTPLYGPYCHNCGQYAVNLNQSFGSFIMEYVSNAFQFDKRILPTLKMLFCKPGALTQEYFKGKISSYVHPLKMNMFLLVVVIAIFALTLKSSSSSIDSNIEDNLKSSIQTYLPMAILLMTPVLGWFIKLFYHKSRKPYMEHFVFALHYSAFLEIIFLVAMLFNSFCNGDWVERIFAIVAQIYLMLATKQYYEGNGWVKCFFKSLAINVLFLIAALMAILAIVFIFLAQHKEIFDVG